MRILLDHTIKNLLLRYFFLLLKTKATQILLQKKKRENNASKKRRIHQYIYIISNVYIRLDDLLKWGLKARPHDPSLTGDWKRFAK